MMAFDFLNKDICSQNKIYDELEEVAKDINDYQIHEDSGEEIEDIRFIEIPKEDYDILRKYDI